MYAFLNRKIVETDFPKIQGYDWFYIPFNALEAAIWFGLCAYVLGRYGRHRTSRYEPLYALSFFAFGCSDVIELYGTTVLLLLFKGACLVAILMSRKVVLAHYPEKKV
ncbi:MAG: hypothetical protein AAF492_22615 [Verrucomicrobiota bacterium]